MTTAFGKSKNGAINGSGPASMLVCTKGPYKNFRYRAEIKINDGGNSGLYFRTTRKPGFTDGYEAQIDSTHSDPIRTGSLYGFCHVYKQLVKPDTWFTYELEVRDDVWRGRKMTRIKDHGRRQRTLRVHGLRTDLSEKAISLFSNTIPEAKSAFAKSKSCRLAD